MISQYQTSVSLSKKIHGPIIAIISHAWRVLALISIHVSMICISCFCPVRPHGRICLWVKGRAKTPERKRDGGGGRGRGSLIESRLHTCCCHGDLCRPASQMNRAANRGKKAHLRRHNHTDPI